MYATSSERRQKGKECYEETGLYNYGYRDYKPEAARFTTVDPIRDGSNWFVYVNSDPINYLDRWGLDKITINNSDPTPGSNQIISSTGNVGHTWVTISDSNNNHDGSYGWGYVSGSNPDSGATVPGALLTKESENTSSGPITSSYTIETTPEQTQAFVDSMNGLVTSGKDYNLGGSSVDSNATMCTESIVNALNSAGVLSSAESAILNAPYSVWSDSFPNPIPQGYEVTAEQVKNLTSPNPNEMENRINQLNESNRQNGCSN